VSLTKGEHGHDHEPNELDEMFRRGLALPPSAGAEYVDRSVDNANDFMMAFRGSLPSGAGAMPGPATNRSRTRGMLNLAMLTALNRRRNPAARAVPSTTA
jgi:hypothetical protein